jgi:AcrR family transcriptional regulator
MAGGGCTEFVDPRVKRTRELLQQALGRLLESTEFEKISVQDITDEATVNRATFYAHYPDKFALFECMVGWRFNRLLTERGVTFDGSCASVLHHIALGVCDYLAQLPRVECERQRHMEPHLESAMIAVIRKMLLGGLKQHPPRSGDSPEIIAATVSWAIFGAAKEWIQTPDRVPSEEIAATVVRLVGPILAV